MSLEALAYLGEVIGAVAVVISLIYLAVQIRQSTQAQRTENYTRALERVANMQALWSQDESLSVLLAKGADDISRLSPPERIRFTYAFLEAFGAFEFMYHAYQDGVIPEKVWSRWSVTVAWWLSTPGVRDWWYNLPVTFTADFTEFVEKILADNPSDPAAMQRWREFISGGPNGRDPKTL